MSDEPAPGRVLCPAGEHHEMPPELCKQLRNEVRIDLRAGCGAGESRIYQPEMTIFEVAPLRKRKGFSFRARGLSGIIILAI